MNVAFIPVRGGSKSIPLKNIKPMNRKPLVYWTIRAACGSSEVDAVYVCTDSEIIRQTVEEIKRYDSLSGREKIHVIGRSEKTATDTASTESAMLEFADNYEFDNIILVQATSPLITSDEISRGMRMLREKDTDSVLSAVKQKRFIWNIDRSGISTPVNYDVFNRPRRQDFDGYYVENGAFYITSKKLLLKTKNRVSGNIKICETNENTFLEIDEPSDWLIIEALLRQNEKEQFTVPEIKMFLTDCDGCLTDGGMYYSEKGDELKRFNTTDGMGFKLLREQGIITGIITGETVELNKRRAEKTGADIIERGAENKLETVRKLCSHYGIDIKNVAYVGDDLNDLEAVKNAGFGCAVSNAAPEVKNAALYVTDRSGGNGAIREVIDLILKNIRREEK